MISIAQETLGLRRTDFSSVLSLLIPAYSLPNAPTALTLDLRRPGNALLPRRDSRRRIDTRGFGGVLEPRYIFGAEPLDQ